MQEHYNLEHNITPRTIQKNIAELLTTIFEQDYIDVSIPLEGNEPVVIDSKEAEKRIKTLTVKMKKAARELNFEEAAILRDEVSRIKKQMMLMDRV